MSSTKQAVVAPPSVDPVRAKLASNPKSSLPLGDPPPRSLSATKEQLYQRACELGSALACNDLAVTIEQDASMGAKLLERSCDLGLARGCTNLALTLQQEPSATHRVEALLRASCDKSDGLACLKLGDLVHDQGDDRLHRQEAYRAYDRGCELKDLSACTAAAWMSSSGQGTSKDPELARTRFTAACDAGQAYACIGLAYQILEDNPSQRDRERAFFLLEQPCNRDIAVACFHRGTILVAADGMIPSTARAEFEHACRLGHELACKLAPLDRIPRDAATADD